MPNRLLLSMTLVLALASAPVFAAIDMTVSQTPNTGAVDNGELVTYTLNYQNLGSTPATGVTLSTNVPNATVFQTSGSTPGWSCGNGAVAGTACTLNIGNVAAGAAGSATYRVLAVYGYPPPSDPGPVALGVCVNALGDALGGNNCASTSLPTTSAWTNVVFGAITDNDSNGVLSCGDYVHVNVSAVTNDGIGQNVQGTGLTGDIWSAPQLPDTTSAGGFAFIAPATVNGPLSPQCGGSTVITGGTVGDGFLHGHVQCAINPVTGSVAAYEFQVQVTTTSGSMIEEAVYHTDDGFNLWGQATIAVQQPCPLPVPDLRLTKVSTPSPVAGGQDLISTLSYANIGSAPSSGVTLHEVVPNNTTFDAAASTAGWSCANGSPAGTACTLAIGALATGASGSATFAALVTAPIPAGVTSIGNSACISSTTADSNNGNDCSTTNTPTGGPNLILSKTATPSPVGAGQTLVYTLSYQNVGNLPSSGTTLTETVPANTTFTTTGSSAGWSCANGSPAGTNCTLATGNLVAGGTGARTFAVVVANPIPAGVTSIGNTACAHPTPAGSDTNAANDCGSVSTPTASPDMTLSKSASPSSVGPGSTITYTLSYSNIGTGAANGVVISELVPANTTFTTTGSSPGWSCANGSPAGTSCNYTIGAVAPAASGSIAFAVIVASPLPGGVTSIGNTACAQPTPASSDSNPANDCGSVTTPTGSPDLTVTKTASPSVVGPGSTITYTLAYSNAGTGPASSVVLNETVPANTTFTTAGSSPGWSCANGSPGGTACSLSAGPVAAAASGSATFVVVVASPLPVGTAQIGNVACAQSTGDSNAANNCGSTSQPPSGAPDLSLLKTAGSGTVDPGQVLVYTLTITNNGNRGAAGVNVSETVPANTTFAAASSSAGWSCADGAPAGSSCAIAVGNIAGGGGTASVTFAVTVDNPLPAGVTAIANTACATDNGSNGTDPDLSNNCGSTSTPPGGAPDLVVTKTANTSLIDPGGVIVYTLQVLNQGNRAASGVILSETVPVATTFVAGSSTAGWSCADASPASTPCTFSVGSLAAGSSTSVLYAVQVLDPLPAGVTQIANNACATDDGSSGTDPNPVNSCGQVGTPTGGAPELAVTKTTTSTVAAAGTTISWDITVTNNGNRSANDVRLQELVPPGTTFNSGLSSLGWACFPDDSAGSTCTYSIGVVNPGDTAAASFVATLLDPLPAGTTAIDNRVCVVHDAADPADPDTSNDCASTSTPTGAPVLAISKALTGGSVAPGALLTYTITVTNTGEVPTAGALRISETVPLGTTFSLADSTAGWSCSSDTETSPCTLDLGPLAAGATLSVQFAVTVNSPISSDLALIHNQACAEDRGNGFKRARRVVRAAAETVCDHVDTPTGIAPNLVTTKTLASGQLLAGDTLVYDIAVSNTGTAAASAVVVNETVPANATFSASASSAGWSCADGAPAGTTCTLALPTLEPGEATSVLFAIALPTPIPAGVTSIGNTACTHDPSDTTTGDDCSTIVVDPPGPTGSPAIEAVKRLVSGQLEAGALLVYAIDVTNSGDAAALATVVTELVPANTTYVAASSSPGWSCSDGAAAGTSCTLNLPSLAAGASTSVSFALRVVSPLPSGVTAVANTACAHDPADTNPADDCNTVIVDPPGPPASKTDIEISLEPGPVSHPAKGGGAIHQLTLVVRNTSALDADNVAVLITLPEGAGASDNLDGRCLPGAEEYLYRCTFGHIAAGEEISVPWGQHMLLAKPYAAPVIAEVVTEAPDDVDSVPNNGIVTEDDYASVMIGQGVSGPVEIPTLSSVGFAFLAVALSLFAVARIRRARS